MPAKTGAVGAWRRELRSGAHGGGRERPAAGFRGGDQLGSECGQTGGRVPGRPSARARREGATTGRPGPAHGEAAQSRVLSGPVGGALSDGRGRLQATGTTAGSGRWQGVAAARDGCVGLALRRVSIHTRGPRWRRLPGAQSDFQHRSWERRPGCRPLAAGNGDCGLAVRTPPSGGAAGLGSAGPWTAPRFLGRTTPPVVGCRGPRKSRVSQLPSTRANQTGAEARTRRRGVCPGPSGRRGRHPGWAETEEEEPAPPDCRGGRPVAGEELASVLFRLRLAWVVRA